MPDQNNKFFKWIISGIIFMPILLLVIGLWNSNIRELFTDQDNGIYLFIAILIFLISITLMGLQYITKVLKESNILNIEKEIQKIKIKIEKLESNSNDK